MSASSKVDLVVANRSLAAVLHELLSLRGLTYVPQLASSDENVFLITTNPAAQDSLIRVLFPVGDLIHRVGGEGDQLLESIQSQIEFNSWSVVGGGGDIEYLSAENALHVTNSFDVLVAIDRFLADLRQARLAVGELDASSSELLYPATDGSADVAVAQWALRIGVKRLVLHADNRRLVIQRVSQLPPPPFSLREIQLVPSDRFSDEAFNRFVELEDLSALELGQCSVVQNPDDVLALIAGITTLHSLTLDGFGCTDRGMAELARLENLSQLTVVSDDITDLGVLSLRHHPKLALLSLTSANLTDDALTAIADISLLQSLHLHDATVTDRGLSSFSQRAAVSQLHTLCITPAPQVTDEGMRSLLAMDRMRALYLPESKVSDHGLELLAAVENLNELDLSDCMEVTDEGIQHLEVHSRLTALWLQNCPLTDNAIESLLRFDQLQRLDVRGSGISGAGIERLRMAMPYCEILADLSH